MVDRLLSEFRRCPEDLQLQFLEKVYSSGSKAIKQKYHGKGRSQIRKSFTELPSTESQTKRMNLIVTILKAYLMKPSSAHQERIVKVNDNFR